MDAAGIPQAVEAERIGLGIEVVGLSKWWPTAAGRLVVFDQLSFTVRAGERLAITGESGTGKSTLLYLLGGLDQANGGSIHLAGCDINKLEGNALADLRNREMGFVWQNYSLLPEFSAEENVAMPLLVRGMRRAKALAEARQRLASVGLSDRLAHQAGELSGGEQQRVALARALSGKPGLLLADEPTGNLDEATSGRVIELLEERQRAERFTLVYVTHNAAFARRADRQLILRRGADGARFEEVVVQ
jgi:lipoprotein-releasing system ATP-binding protein